MVLTDCGIPYTMWGKRPQKNSLVLKKDLLLLQSSFFLKATVLPQRKRLILSFGDVRLTASILKTLKLT